MTLAVSLLAVAPAIARAQPPLTVQGRVVRQTVDGVRPVAREEVTLHRVNARDAGPVDSLTTDAAGRFAFRVQRPDSQSMYLASSRYGGIAYFSAPVQPGQPAAPSEIVVYDTTSAPVRLQVQGRHLVVSAPNADGVRSVIDVLEIQNDTVLTRVAGASNRATFSLLLPDGANNVRASQGEQGSGAVELRNGRAEVFAPLAPGLRQVVLTYELANDVFPLAVPLDHAVAVLEVLLEEPGATVTGGGLASQGGVTVDGKTFTRYLGQDAPATAVLTVRAGAGGATGGLPGWLLPLTLTAATLGMILLLARRPTAATLRPVVPSPLAPPPAAPARSSAQQLADRVVAIDALLAGGRAHPASLDGLRAHRAQLADELARVLADGTGVK